MDLKKLGISIVSAVTLMSVANVATADHHLANAQTRVHSAELNNHWAHQVGKSGYIFKITNHGNNLKHYRGVFFTTRKHSKHGVTYVNAKQVRALAKRHMTFKVVGANTRGNIAASMTLALLSKNGKYRYQCDFYNRAIYNKYATNKQLKPIVKAELTILNHYFYTKNIHLKTIKAEIKKVDGMAKHLHGTPRKVAMQSVKQLKTYLSTQESADFPILLMGLL